MTCRGCKNYVLKPSWMKGQCKGYCKVQRTEDDAKYGYLAKDGHRYMEVSEKNTCLLGNQWRAQ